VSLFQADGRLARRGGGTYRATLCAANSRAEQDVRGGVGVPRICEEWNVSWVGGTREDGGANKNKRADEDADRGEDGVMRSKKMRRTVMTKPIEERC